MTIKRQGILRAIDNEKKVIGDKRQYSRRQQMAIDVVAKSLQIVDGRGARNKKKVPGTRNTREETIKIELAVAPNSFSSKTAPPNFHYSNTLKNHAVEMP